MPDYGSREYYEEEVAKDERRLRISLRGFATIINEDKYADVADFIPYVEDLESIASSLAYNKKRLEEIEATEGDEE